MKYAILDFDSKDTQDQYAILYNYYSDGSGDIYSEWFDTEEQRAKKIEKDIKNGVVFFNNWGEKNA
jgi:hypothetical protein